jgi:hypothetical protein
MLMGYIRAHIMGPNNITYMIKNFGKQGYQLKSAAPHLGQVVSTSQTLESPKSDIDLVVIDHRSFHSQKLPVNSVHNSLAPTVVASFKTPGTRRPVSPLH